MRLALLILALASSQQLGCSRTGLFATAADSDGSFAGAGGSTTDAAEPLDGQGGADVADAGDDDAAAGDATLDAPDDGNWAPWYACVRGCFASDDWGGYYTLMTFGQRCICNGLCAPYCMTDTLNACTSMATLPDYADCNACLVQDAMLGTCLSDSGLSSVKAMLHCIRGCGTPPLTAPAPRGSIGCTYDGFGSPVYDPALECCPATPPIPKAACTQSISCVYGTEEGTTECACKGDERWECWGYGEAPYVDW